MPERSLDLRPWLSTIHELARKLLKGLAIVHTAQRFTGRISKASSRSRRLGNIFDADLTNLKNPDSPCFNGLWSSRIAHHAAVQPGSRGSRARFARAGESRLLQAHCRQYNCNAMDAIWVCYHFGLLYHLTSMRSPVITKDFTLARYQGHVLTSSCSTLQSNNTPCQISLCVVITDAVGRATWGCQIIYHINRTNSRRIFDIEKAYDVFAVSYWQI